MKFLFRSSPSHVFRSTLLDLHSSGVMQVYRRHSLLRLWVPLRENACHTENDWN
jgi:hypothetical protein